MSPASSEPGDVDTNQDARAPDKGQKETSRTPGASNGGTAAHGHGGGGRGDASKSPSSDSDVSRGHKRPPIEDDARRRQDLSTTPDSDHEDREDRGPTHKKGVYAVYGLRSVVNSHTKGVLARVAGVAGIPMKEHEYNPSLGKRKELGMCRNHILLPTRN